MHWITRNCRFACHHRRRCHRYGVRFFLQQPGSAGNRRRDAGRDTGRRYGPRAGGYAPCRVRQAGNQVHAECKVVSVMPDTAEASSLIQVNYETADGPGSVVAERLLMSVGRRPVMKGFGLENLGLERTERGNVFVNGQMQTSSSRSICLRRLDGIFLAGAYSRPRGRSSHTFHHWQEGCHELPCHPRRGIYQSRNSRCGRDRRILQKRGVAYRAVKLPMAYSGRFVAAENEGVNGVCKLLLGGDDTVLGHMSWVIPLPEIITLAGMAIELKLTADEWKKIVFPHPRWERYSRRHCRTHDYCFI